MHTIKHIGEFIIIHDGNPPAISGDPGVPSRLCAQFGIHRGIGSLALEISGPPRIIRG